MKSPHTPRYARMKQLIVEARKDQGITQVELAEMLDRPQSFISKVEQGERRLDVTELLDIIEVLQIDPISFVEDLLSVPSDRKRSKKRQKRR